MLKKVLIVVLGLAVLAGVGWGAIDNIITIQGRLLDGDGNPIANRTYNGPPFSSLPSTFYVAVRQPGSSTASSPIQTTQFTTDSNGVFNTEADLSGWSFTQQVEIQFIIGSIPVPGWHTLRPAPYAIQLTPGEKLIQGTMEVTRDLIVGGSLEVADDAHFTNRVGIKTTSFAGPEDLLINSTLRLASKLTMFATAEFGQIDPVAHIWTPNNETYDPNEAFIGHTATMVNTADTLRKGTIFYDGNHFYGVLYSDDYFYVSAKLDNETTGTLPGATFNNAKLNGTAIFNGGPVTFDAVVTAKKKVDIEGPLYLFDKLQFHAGWRMNDGPDGFTINKDTAVFKFSPTGPYFNDKLILTQDKLLWADIIGKPDLNLYALKTDLAGYVINTNFTWANLTGKPDLNIYAKTADLAGYVTTANFTWGNLAGKPDLNLYALKTDLANYALKTDLTGYVTNTNFTWGNLAGKPTNLLYDTSSLSAAKLTGALPAISGAALTGLTATQITGTFGTTQIADAAITSAKIADLAATKLTGKLAVARMPIGGTWALGEGQGLIIQTKLATKTAVNALTIGSDGKLLGNITSISDERLKSGVTSLSGALGKLSLLNGVSFEWNDLAKSLGKGGEGKQIGVIAQDLEKVYPELVTTGQDGYKSVDYGKLSVVLLEAVKELKAENEALKARVDALETSKK